MHLDLNRRRLIWDIESTQGHDKTYEMAYAQIRLRINTFSIAPLLNDAKLI